MVHVSELTAIGCSRTAGLADRGVEAVDLVVLGATLLEAVAASLGAGGSGATHGVTGLVLAAVVAALETEDVSDRHLGDVQLVGLRHRLSNGMTGQGQEGKRRKCVEKHHVGVDL